MNKLSITYVVLMTMLVSFFWCGSVQADVSREYKLKAAYILNFAKFIYWPESAEDTSESFNICIIGDSPFGDILDGLSSKKVKNKKIKVEYSEEYNKDNQCKIVYISQDKADSYNEILESINNEVILTVSDIEGFCQSGGMIEFIRVKNKIKFEINVEQSLKSNIKYRSQLLEVAEKLR